MNLPPRLNLADMRSIINGHVLNRVAEIYIMLRHPITLNR